MGEFLHIGSPLSLSCQCCSLGAFLSTGLCARSAFWLSRRALMRGYPKSVGQDSQNANRAILALKFLIPRPSKRFP